MLGAIIGDGSSMPQLAFDHADIMRDADALRSLFSIPESETIMAVISLGYRAQKPRQPQHRPLDDIVKFF